MEDFRQAVARTAAGLEEYDRLEAATAHDAPGWQAAADAVAGTDRGERDLKDVGELLAHLAAAPLRLSVKGRALPGAPRPLPDLYEATYRAWQHARHVARAMERLWYSPDSPAPESADALRFLTWQLRDAHDELDWLERGLDRDEARAIRAGVDGARARRERKPYVRTPKARFTSWELDDPTPVYREVALLQDRAPGDVRRAVEAAEAAGMDRTEALVREYGAGAPCGVLTGIDLETTGLSPWSDWIVDAGWERYDLATGRAFDAQRHTYGVSAERAKLGIAPRIVALNGIDIPALEGHTPFQEDAEAQHAMMAALDDTVMVAHNARFERHFLTANCDGFAEAVRSGATQILDSRMVAVHADDARFRGFTLEGYAGRHGAIDEARGASVPAAGGGSLPLDQGEHERHLGLEDTHIMMVALRNHLGQLHGRFVAGAPVMVDDMSPEEPAEPANPDQPTLF
ncbi:MAG: 3'-5' exonuclease [Bifidobacterium sp.]|nr:3'-5' exonuclease [Bifidobacterium sp.]